MPAQIASLNKCANKKSSIDLSLPAETVNSILIFIAQLFILPVILF